MCQICNWFSVNTFGATNYLSTYICIYTCIHAYTVKRWFACACKAASSSGIPKNETTSTTTTWNCSNINLLFSHQLAFLMCCSQLLLLMHACICLLLFHFVSSAVALLHACLGVEENFKQFHLTSTDMHWICLIYTTIYACTQGLHAVCFPLNFLTFHMCVYMHNDNNKIHILCIVGELNFHRWDCQQQIQRERERQKKNCWKLKNKWRQLVSRGEYENSCMHAFMYDAKNFWSSHTGSFF